jgi:hypothetical protein
LRINLKNDNLKEQNDYGNVFNKNNYEDNEKIMKNIYSSSQNQLMQFGCSDQRFFQNKNLKMNFHSCFKINNAHTNNVMRLSNDEHRAILKTNPANIEKSKLYLFFIEMIHKAK